MVGKNSSQLVIIDNSGKAYTLNPRDLPGARGHGDPVSSFCSLPDKPLFNNLLLGNKGDDYLLASSDAYGYVVPFAEMCSRNKAGKSVVNLSEGSVLLPACKVKDEEFVACISSSGFVLIFPLEQVARLNRGRGHRFIALKKKDQETLKHVLVFKRQQDLRIYCGKRSMVLRWRDIESMVDNRARRGKLLPRGFTQVAKLECIQDE